MGFPRTFALAAAATFAAAPAHAAGLVALTGDRDLAMINGESGSVTGTMAAIDPASGAATESGKVEGDLGAVRDLAILPAM